MASPIQQALQLAADRGLLPTALGTAEIRELGASILDRSFWSARTTHAKYLKDLKGLVERYTKGEGYNNDLAQLRIEARRLLVSYGYTPEKGFPGDAELGVPEAMPASLQDLSSERRLNLIFDTQTKLMRGLGQKIRGMDRMETAPAWELVRIEDRRVPREWLERFAIASDNVDHVGVYDLPGRMVARKDSPVWAALGSSALFEDALDVDHSPFAFGSGMGWLERFAVDLPELLSVAIPAPLPANVIPFKAPEPEIFIGGQSTFEMLAARLRARQAAAAEARP